MINIDWYYFIGIQSMFDLSYKTMHQQSVHDRHLRSRLAKIAGTTFPLGLDKDKKLLPIWVLHGQISLDMAPNSRFVSRID